MQGVLWGAWEGSSLVLVIRKCLGLREDQNGEALEGWYGRQILKAVIRVGLHGEATSGSARAGQCSCFPEWRLGSRRGAERWDVTWVGTLDPTTLEERARFLETCV